MSITIQFIPRLASWTTHSIFDDNQFQPLIKLPTLTNTKLISRTPDSPYTAYVSSRISLPNKNNLDIR